MTNKWGSISRHSRGFHFWHASFPFLLFLSVCFVGEILCCCWWPVSAATKRPFFVESPYPMTCPKQPINSPPRLVVLHQRPRSWYGDPPAIWLGENPLFTSIWSSYRWCEISRCHVWFSVPKNGCLALAVKTHPGLGSCVSLLQVRWSWSLRLTN